MVNRLPEKLTALRKHYGFAQGDLAQKMGVAVNEYMNWENGNSIPMMEQLKALSGIFRVPLQNLVDNTKEITLPEIAKDEEDSIEIPFIQDDAQDALSSLYDMKQSAPEDTEENLGETKIMNTQQFQQTEVNKIVDDEPEEYDDEEYEDYDDDEDEDDDEPIGFKELFSRKKDTSHKEHTGEKKPFDLKWLIIGVIAIIVILIGILVINLMKKPSTSVEISSDNRFAVGDTYTLYLKDKGVLETTGNNAPSLDSDGLVQISANGRNAIGLKENGRVVVSGNASYASEVKSWEDITYIALGASHAVGVKSDGSVECTGSSNACDVSAWKDIAKVYAGNDITIGQTKDGALVSSGNFSSADRINALKNVSSVSIGTNEIAVINVGGTVSCYAIGTDATSNTAVWTSVNQVAVGNQYVAGLSSGRVLLAASDEKAVETVKAWTDSIKYIGTNGNTLAAVTSKDTVIGIGDNSSRMYTETAVTETAPAATSTPTASATAAPQATSTPTAQSTQLKTPSNLTYTITAANVELNWNGVEGADYYEVTVSTNPATKLQSAKNSASIPADKFTDATSYTIAVTAYANNNSVKPSATASGQMVYSRVTTQLAQPTGLSASSTNDGLVISWNAVTNAEYYHVAVGNNAVVDVKDGTSYTVKDLNLGTYPVAVSAVSSNAKFTESTAAYINAEFSRKLGNVDVTTISQSVDGSNNWIISWAGVANAGGYTITIGDFSNTTSSTSTTVPAGTLPAGTYAIKIQVNPSEENKNKYLASDVVSADRQYAPVVVTTPEPTPVPPTPETTPDPASTEPAPPAEG